MSIANHGLVGAIIAIAIKQPVLALPLALLSHYVLDALPHFGYGGKGFGEAFRHPQTFVEVCFSGVAFVVMLWLLWPFGWIGYAGALVAISPDLVWPYRYFLYERYGKAPRPNGPLTHFHEKIQWAERPWGILIEIPLTIILFIVFLRLQP